MCGSALIRALKHGPGGAAADRSQVSNSALPTPLYPEFVKGLGNIRGGGVPAKVGKLCLKSHACRKLIPFPCTANL